MTIILDVYMCTMVMKLANFVCNLLYCKVGFNVMKTLFECILWAAMIIVGDGFPVY